MSVIYFVYERVSVIEVRVSVLCEYGARLLVMQSIISVYPDNDDDL